MVLSCLINDIRIEGRNMKNRILHVSVILVLALVMVFSVGLGTAQAQGSVPPAPDDNAGWTVDSGDGLFVPVTSGSEMLLPVTGNGFLIPVTGSGTTTPPVTEKNKSNI